jgi:CheY-like chemotaxis protein
MQMMREIEQRHQLPRAVDIIGFSADESDEMNQLMLDGGANRVVSKPPDPGELEKACEDIKEKRRGLLSVAV